VFAGAPEEVGAVDEEGAAVEKVTGSREKNAADEGAAMGRTPPLL
jgi:hypothetical protein